MALKVATVVKRFGEKVAVDGISFEMDKPGIFGLLGTNGAGKTTTIRMILGILDRDGGMIEWDGKPVIRENVRFGYLPEERGLYPKAKVEEQLLYFARLRGVPARQAKKTLEYWFDRLNVMEYKGKPAEQLSKGNQQKIQLISALVHDPQLIVLDEPLSGLDPVNTELFKSVIGELLQNQKYIIMSSHQMGAIEEYCQDILILKDGRTVLQGNLNVIKRSYGRTNLLLKCDEETLLADMIAHSSLRLVSKTPNGYEMKISSEQEAYVLLQRLMEKQVGLTRFEIREPSLHEIFIEKAGE